MSLGPRTGFVLINLLCGWWVEAKKPHPLPDGLTIAKAHLLTFLTASSL